MEKTIEHIDFAKGDGIVPVIVQDANSKQVLTLAYTNKESLELTKRLVIRGFGVVPGANFG